MTFLVISLALAAAMAAVVRPAFASDPRLPVAWTDGRAVVTVFPLFLAATLLIGLDFALAAMLAFLVKEFGQAIGYRLAGHEDARFRMLPAPGAPAISALPPQSDLSALFILLTSAGFGLAPMIVAVALGEAMAESAPRLAEAARSYALAAGAVNFIALLPLWPLPGGQLFRMLVEARLPSFGGLATAALCAFGIGLSITLQSMLLFLLSVVCAAAMIREPVAPVRPRLTRAQVRIGFTAYFATLAAYFISGAWVIQVVPLGQ